MLLIYIISGLLTQVGFEKVIKHVEMTDVEEMYVKICRPVLPYIPVLNTFLGIWSLFCLTSDLLDEIYLLWLRVRVWCIVNGITRARIGRKFNMWKKIRNYYE